MTNSMEPVRERFEREAVSFDAIYRLEQSVFWRWFNTRFRKGIFLRYDMTFAEAGDVTGKQILDIGCGSGVYVADFARRGAARVVGVDLAANMLAIARQQAEEQGVAERCEFVQGNFLDLDLSGPFDVTFAMGVFDYLPEPLPFLRKMAQVTSGRIIISFPGHSPIRARLRRLRYRLLSKGNVFFYAENDVRRLAQNAGLSRFHIIPVRVSGTGFMLVAEA